MAWLQNTVLDEGTDLAATVRAQTSQRRQGLSLLCQKSRLPPPHSMAPLPARAQPPNAATAWASFARKPWKHLRLWYVQDKKVRDLVNLLGVATGKPPNAAQSKDGEEIEEINNLIGKYQLKGKIGWIKAPTDGVCNDEIYCYITDTKGEFVQHYIRLAVIEAINFRLPANVHDKSRRASRDLRFPHN
ncbi:uncharacterized protein [Triticum aestivum]|uniref:uncharacterized protein n=1 Tax=Triticum aestivum TaxID=4565 RepID=UPI001D025CCB|nr:uncharacterized protein LOC123050523 [Triticum aestivum]